MLTAGWWDALWPDPAGVLAAVGVRSGMDVIDLCSGDGWFTLQIAKLARQVSAIDIDPNLLEVAKDRQTLFSWRMPFMAFLIALGLRRQLEQH